MRVREIIAHDIWRAREEVGVDGNADHDWWLAGELLKEVNDGKIEYFDIYQWMMEKGVWL